ncbi:hypothetical protein BLX41_23055 [Pseudomonas protegens]|uniref:hypothetical protein n=1 Tax=Pseudomonas protegens TaxID=380021 RepID=UPI000F4B4CDC|nr:hypothetical protein [Pseudomonas protegens]ROL66733.1 hypothetical protein BLX41_23055 [Pseudomonas protegens]
MSPAIQTREDMSFTRRDDQGRLINWPRNNPGAAEDWRKGAAFFDCEVCELASHDETEAFDAIRFALLGMGGWYTNLEVGFVDRVARAAVMGLRGLRGGTEQFEPADRD